MKTIRFLYIKLNPQFLLENVPKLQDPTEIRRERVLPQRPRDLNPKALTFLAERPRTRFHAPQR